jgi:sugar/nucleoside kinase (ribokinase family)
MKKNVFDVITIGGATRDITFYTKEGKLIANPSDPLRQKLLGFEYGAKIGIREAFFTFGGGAANTAVCFSRLGLKVATILRVGNDENGRAVVANLKKNKVETKFVQIDKKAKTGFSFIVTFGPAREHTAFLYRGANDKLQIINYKLQNLKTDWFYVSSLSGEKWREIMNRVVSYCPPVKLAWNPGARQLAAGLSGLKNYLRKTKILLINKDEAIELVVSLSRYKKMSVSWLNEPKNLFRVLYEFGPKILVITDGPKGAYAFDGQNFYYQKALSEKIVDTTGAGDSFCASFVAGQILYKGDIKKSLKLAAINSAYNLTGIGAQEPLLTRKEAEHLMK